MGRQDLRLGADEAPGPRLLWRRGAWEDEESDEK